MLISKDNEIKKLKDLNNKSESSKENQDINENNSGIESDSSDDQIKQAPI